MYSHRTLAALAAVAQSLCLPPLLMLSTRTGQVHCHRLLVASSALVARADLADVSTCHNQGPSKVTPKLTVRLQCAALRAIAPVNCFHTAMLVLAVDSHFRCFTHDISRQTPRPTSRKHWEIKTSPPPRCKD